MISLVQTVSLFDAKRLAGPALGGLLRSRATPVSVGRVNDKHHAVQSGSGVEKSVVAQNCTASLEERVFDRSVELKVLLAQYTAHLNRNFSRRAFAEIDRLLDAEGWYEEDPLVEVGSFREFVKWAIYANNFEWTSFGSSEQGHLLVAWKIGSSLLTANFSGRGSVRWTARILGNEGNTHVAGDGPLIAFAKQSGFLFAEMKASGDELSESAKNKQYTG